MNILNTAKQRYSTKKFSNKKIQSKDIEEIKSLLQLTPSSINSQPWHFIIVSNDESKKRLSKATEGMFSFNKDKIIEASHSIIFCSKTDIDKEYIMSVGEKEYEDGRFESKEQMEKSFFGYSLFVDSMRSKPNILESWMEKQVYIAVGSLLLGAAAMNIDAVPIEGFDKNILDEEFDLSSKNLKSLCIVSMGYRSENEDYNYNLPKSRLPMNKIITEL